jgi:hypothetical protein
MADLGNILDGIFKAPFEDALHDLENAAEGEAKTIVQTAQTDAANAEAAIAKAAASSQAAIDAVVGPSVQTGVTALVNAVPVIGPLASGEAGQAASTVAVAVVNGLIAELQKLVPAAAPAATT